MSLVERQEGASGGGVQRGGELGTSFAQVFHRGVLDMWLLDALYLLLYVVGPLLGALTGVVFGGRLALYRVKELEYGLAALEERLIREVKKRAAEASVVARQEPPPNVEEAVSEIRRLAVGTVDDQGWLHGKEGGVKRGVL
jgi:hypothetical protein